jgi:hypothetical protein
MMVLEETKAHSWRTSFSQVDPYEYDVRVQHHRQFLIERCKWAAARLFRIPNLQPAPDHAEEKLRCWSTSGERYHKSFPEAVYVVVHSSRRNFTETMRGS